MSEPTPDEKRAHMAGLLLATARLTAKLACVIGEDFASDAAQPELAAFGGELQADAKALQRFADEIDEGRLRGRVHNPGAALPGTILAPEDIKPKTPHPFSLSATSMGCRVCGLPAQSHGVDPLPPLPPRKPAIRSVGAADYDTGPAPDLMALARKVTP